MSDMLELLVDLFYTVVAYAALFMFVCPWIPIGICAVFFAFFVKNLKVCMEIRKKKKREEELTEEENKLFLDGKKKLVIFGSIFFIFTTVFVTVALVFIQGLAYM